MMKTNSDVVVIGAGLAGCEACYQLAKRGVEVDLIDIKPSSFTPAHKNPNFAEIVCSNSLKSADITTASGILKKELELFDSLILKVAKTCSVPAGNALAVDREEFSKKVTDTIRNFKNVHIISQEIKKLPKDKIVIVATGPLTTDAMSKELREFFDEDNLHFYDASSPIVDGSSIDFSKAFIKDRYDKGNGDYINCPMNKEEYLKFYNELISAKRVELKSFEKKEIFEGCMPVEIMASRGVDALRYGPLKPIGLDNPKTHEKYYAVVQLRKEDNTNSLFNMVGFQTNLTFLEQKRVFSLIPGLTQAKFIKYGVMHRNSYINAPKVLRNTFQTKKDDKIFIAGQLSGVEGYMESTASGLVCGINAYLLLKNKPLIEFNSKTVLGGIINYITSFEGKNFQPMNANFGVVEVLDKRIRDEKERKKALSDRSICETKKIVEKFKV